LSGRLSNRRLRLLVALFGLVFVVTLARAVWLQAVRAQSLGRLAARQQTQSVEIPAGRGAMFDRTGVQLAIGEQASTVYADPQAIRRPAAVAQAAARFLGIDPNALYPQLLDKRRHFVYIRRKADPDHAKALIKKRFAGVFSYPEERRTYPQHSVGAQVLGYAGVDNQGLAGLELALDPQLRGRPGKETIVKDPFGHVVDTIGVKPERDGRDVFLTLDHTIQANAEAVLRETVARWNAKSATAVVLDPATGAILAMAVVPTFDANRYPDSPREIERNRAVTDTYEPGSTFKLVTVGAVLSDRLVSAGTSLYLPYSVHVADRVIHDAEPRGGVTYSVAQILSHSSNVGTIVLAQLLRKQRLLGWISRFGFGRPTGVDFPGESRGIVLPGDEWSGSTIGNVPIGQGIAVTPLQLAAAYAAVANRGVWVTPHLVDHVVGEPRRRLERRRVVSPDVASQLLSMLQNVVAEGTGTHAAVPGYVVAGKTGTSNKPDAQGGYSDSRYWASFVGIVPASAPRLVILVQVDEPQGGIFGGEVAAPAFQKIARFDLQYLDVPPDDPSSFGTPAGSG
jgi:cell division protein FtsI (penicillin-binding protein 3)